VDSPVHLESSKDEYSLRYIPFDPKKMVIKGYLLLNQDSISVSNSCINILSLFSLYRLFFLLISLEWLWLFFTLEDSMFFAALTSLSWLIKHPVVAHLFLRSLVEAPYRIIKSDDVQVPFTQPWMDGI
jgi:hypothetical protein